MKSRLRRLILLFSHFGSGFKTGAEKLLKTLVFQHFLSSRDDIKAELKVDFIITLDEEGYPPVPNDEVFKEIFEQGEF